MILSAIVAVAARNAIGRNNTLPWHLPEDLKFFKRTTMGKPLLMGRKTFESFGGRPLPGRLNIVLSRNPLPELPEGVAGAGTLEEGILLLRSQGTDEGFVIGGSRVFEEALPLLDRMYITRIDTEVPDADTFFPEVDYASWQLTSEEHRPADDRHPYSYTFQQFDRAVR